MSFRSELELLRRHGHEVRTYTRDNREIPGQRRVRLAARTLWNRRTVADFDELIGEWRPDVAHFNNTFPLISLSGVHAVKRARVPVVLSVRNYRFRCANGLFFRQGAVCEDCLGRSVPWPAVAHACYRDDRAASAVTGTMIALHRAIRTYERKVDVLIALSSFAREAMIRDGLPAEKIVVKPNFLLDDPGPGAGGGGYALYVGRLSREKGLHTLVASWRLVHSDLRLKIVGDGPLLESLTHRSASDRIELLGSRSHAEVLELMGRADILVLPSEWYETFGRVGVESLARGTPVVASRIGAVAELVDHGRTGRLFAPGDAEDLAAQVDAIMGNRDAIRQMRENARSAFADRYTPDRNYEQLIKIYERAIQNIG